MVPPPNRRTPGTTSASLFRRGGAQRGLGPTRTRLSDRKAEPTDDHPTRGGNRGCPLEGAKAQEPEVSPGRVWGMSGARGNIPPAAIAGYKPGIKDTGR